MSTADDMAQAHKLLAQSCGSLALMLASKRLSPKEVTACLVRCEEASLLLHKIIQEATK